MNIGEHTKKVGFVALIGRPNSGKSTFVNTLIDEKVSIVSEKPQTTQKRIRGIYNDDDSQIIFFDTPGVNEGKGDFFGLLNERVKESLSWADVIVRFIDSSRKRGTEDAMIEAMLEGIDVPVVDVLSKYDTTLLENMIADDISENEPDFPVRLSRKGKQGYDALLSRIKNLLQIGPLQYDEEYYTDQDYETRIAEIIREKIFRDFYEELPYSTFIEVGDIDDTPDILRIQAYVFCESESQKQILVGKAGQSIVKIGKEARQDLEEIYGKKIFLALRVKVMPKWKRNKKLLNRLY